MKFALFSVLLAVAAGLSAIGLAAPAWAEPIQGGATDLLIPEVETTAPFAYDLDELDQLSTQINHSVSVDSQSPVPIVRTSQDFNAPDFTTPDGVVIINSGGNVAGGREIPFRDRSDEAEVEE